MIENPNVICNDCGYCKQNTKLKELLKECRNYTQIMVDAANLRHLEWHEDTAYNDGKDILAKINKVLGEDK